MGERTELIEAAKKQGVDLEKIGKSGMAGILLVIIVYFGNRFTGQQDELTKAIIDGNVITRDLAHTQSQAVDEMKEAVDEMKEARIAFEARE
jgi:hypothetical protein